MVYSKKNKKIKCPGGCGKTVAVWAASGLISCHDKGRWLCPATDKTPDEARRFVTVPLDLEAP